ncbi:unnamed protein product [Urochloa humidicola]
MHIPWRRGQEVDAVWVFTLGRDTTSWREVAVTAPGASYSKNCGEVVSVDGVMYWLNAASNRIMELDLGDERATWLDVPPCVRAGPTPEEGGWRLTSIHARLGIAVTASWDGVEVWVLDGLPRTRLYKHKVGSLIGRDGDDGRLLPLPEGVAELVMDEDDGMSYYRKMKTFAYVETLEPLPAICRSC